MPTGFWELFVQRVTTNPHRHISDDLNRLGGEIAVLLASHDTRTAAEALSALSERIAQRYDEIRRAAQEPTKQTRGEDTSTNNSPETPRCEDSSIVSEFPDIFRPIPVPPEVLDEANRTFNEEEIAEAIREIRRSGGLKFEDVIHKLDALPSEPHEA